AYETVQRAWATPLEQAAALPAGAVDESVDGEWSFAQTLRHLVGATDIWLRHAVQRVEQPFHPLGVFGDYADEGPFDLSVLTDGTPTYDEVLAARADRVGMVRDFLDTVTPDQLDEPRANPWAPAHPETVRSCLHTILEEEWEHHRFAVRDLGTIAGRAAEAG